eukprot:6172863-Pleurochrysis_carterae.AAC.1
MKEEKERGRIGGDEDSEPQRVERRVGWKRLRREGEGRTRVERRKRNLEVTGKEERREQGRAEQRGNGLQG